MKLAASYLNLSLQELLYFTLRIAVLFATVFWGISHPDEVQRLKLFQYTLAFFAIYSIFLFSLLIRYRENFKKIFLLSTSLDIIILTLFQLETGGMESPFFLGYYLSTILLAVYYGTRVGLSTAAVSAVLITITDYAQLARFAGEGHWEDILVTFGFIFTLAIMGGILNIILQQEKEEITQLQKITFDQLERLETLYRVSGAITHWADFQALIKELASQAARAMHAEHCVIFIKDQSGTLRPAVNVPSEVQSIMQKLAVEAAESDNPIQAALTGANRDADQKGEPLTAILVAPMTSGTRIQGCMAVSRKNAPFSVADRELLTAISGGAGASIESAHLHQTAQHHLLELKSIVNIVSATNRGAELDEVFEITLNQLRDLFQCEYGVVYLADPEFNLMSPQKSFGYAIDELDGLSFYLNECQCMASDEPLIVRDAAGAVKCGHLKSRDRSFACMPLKANGSVLGLLHLSSKNRDSFNEEHHDFIRSIGEQLALAIHRSNLFASISTMAVTDALTGLWNFGEFQRRIKEEVRRSERYSHSFVLLMIDIDYFKMYNDRWGHQRGDQVIKRISDLLRQCVRETDSVCRYGGEEFCVIIPETDKTQALLMAERMRETVSENNFPGEDEQPNKNITISIGLASFPDDAINGENLIAKADEALYKAKHLGRDRIIVTQQMDQPPLRQNQENN